MHAILKLIVTAVITAGLLAGCGGSGSGGTTPDDSVPDGPAVMPEPTARLLSLSPANGETVTSDVKPVIVLSVTHASAINPTSGPTLLCNSRKIPFTQASSLSADGKVMTITLSPQAGAILLGESCTVSGEITPTGQGGGIDVPISIAFSIAV